GVVAGRLVQRPAKIVAPGDPGRIMRREADLLPRGELVVQPVQPPHIAHEVLQHVGGHHALGNPYPNSPPRGPSTAPPNLVYWPTRPVRRIKCSSMESTAVSTRAAAA